METKFDSQVNYSDNYSDEGLFSKIGCVCRKAGSKLIYCVLLLYYVLTDEKTPASQKLLILSALGYFILPVDLIPDFIPVVGFADDTAAIAACVNAVKNNITPSIKDKAVKKMSEWFGNVDQDEIRDAESML